MKGQQCWLTGKYFHFLDLASQPSAPKIFEFMNGYFSLLKNYSVRFCDSMLQILHFHKKIVSTFRLRSNNKSFQMYWSSWIYPKMFFIQMFLHVQMYVFMDTGQDTVTQNVTSNEWCSSDPTSIFHIQLLPEERLCLFAWTALKEDWAKC